MSYERLNNKDIKIVPLLELSFTDALKSVHRKISQRSLRKAGKISVRSKLHKLVFWEFYRAIKNWSSEFGRTLSVSKNRQGFVKQYKIVFHHKGTLKFHLGKLVPGDLDKYLVKKFAAGSRGVVEVNETTPFHITFNTNRNEMIFDCKFNTINRYGNVC